MFSSSSTCLLDLCFLRCFDLVMLMREANIRSGGNACKEVKENKIRFFAINPVTKHSRKQVIKTSKSVDCSLTSNSAHHFKSQAR